MAEKDSQGPSLELPSLFKRKHSSDSGRADTAATPPADTSSTAATASSDDTAVLPTAQPEAPEAPAPQSPPPARPAPGSGDGAGESERPAERRPQLTLPSVRAPRAGRRDRETDRPAASDAGTPTSPAAEGASGPAPEAAAAAPAEAPTREQEPVAPQAPAAPTPAPAASAPAASAPAGTAPAAPAGPTPVPAATRVAAPESDAAPRTGDQRSPKRERGRPTLPALAATTAALVVGAAVGLLGVVLTFLGLRGCELVAGTSSCGGPGLLVLVAIFVAMVLAGGAALKLFGVPEAGSVSFLGTGLLMVVLLFFFLDALDHPSMLIVIPAIAALCFAVARWVTTQLSEDVMAER